MKSTRAFQSRGIIAALTFSICWATTGVIVRSLPHLSSFIIVSGRCLIAFFALWPVLIWTDYRHNSSLLSNIKSKQFWSLSSLMVAYYLLVILAYKNAPVAEIALINGSSPIFVLLYQLMKREPLIRKEIIGALITLLGLLLIVLPALAKTNTLSKGIFFGLLASMTIAFYAILYRKSALENNAPNQTVLTQFTFLIGAILFPIMAMDQWQNLDLQILWSTRNVMLLSFLGIFSTAIPTLCYSIAAQALSPLITTSFRLLTPVIATLLAWYFLKEIPGLFIIPGGLLILFGLTVMVYK